MRTDRLLTISIAIEKRWPWLLALCIAIYLIFTLAIDWKRPLWNDELFTYYIARRPNLSDVWAALMTGAEQLPPLFFVIVRASIRLLGPTNLAFRLPETLGFLGMSMAAFLFVKRRCSPTYGLIAFILPSLTYAYSFAYEARPYGLVMGFCGGAVLFWQRAADPNRRRWSLFVLSACLASALACHYYAILIFFPFFLAEVARFWRTRRLDIGMWVAICAGLFPLVVFLPLIRAAAHYSSKFWAKPQWTSIVSFYEQLLGNSALALVLVLVVIGSLIRNQQDERPQVNHTGRVPLHDLVLAFGFALIPVIAIVLAKFITGAFTSRYAIYAVLGISILVGFSFSSFGRRTAAFGLIAAALLLGCWMVIAVRQYRTVSANASDEQRNFGILQAIGSTHPLVIAGPHAFFEISHLASLNGKGHFLFLADVNGALQYTGTDTVERGLLALKQFAPLDVRDYREFAGAHSHFLVCAAGDPFAWVLGDLLKAGRPVSIYSATDAGLIYSVGPHE